MRLLAELKRRKVFQTAAIYAAAAWLMLQVAGLLVQAFEVPAWGLKLVIVVLLVGFPIALVLSWMHELTPEGLRRESAPGEPSSPPATPSPKAAMPAAETPPPPPPVPGEHSIAVLPFDNMSDDPANAHFADGLSEELLNLCSRIPGLRVVARTSSFSFRGKAVGAAAIARELQVSHLLEGSVRRAGQRIRITAQLIRGADSSHVWSQSFDRDLDDIFAVQDEIAAAVADELEVKLLGRSAPKSRQTHADAYAHFLRGRHFLDLASRSSYQQAIAEFEASLAIDPRFAPALASLGALYWSGANNSLIDYAEGARRAQDFSRQALAIDPNLAEPMALLGYFEVIEGVDRDAGLRRLERARQLEPHNPRILARLSNLALRDGCLDDALRHAHQALRADPLAPFINAVYGSTCYFAGRLDEAESLRRRVLELSPGWLSGRFYLGMVLLARGDAVAALAEIEREQSEFWRHTGLAIVQQALGNRAASDAALAALLSGDHGGGAYQIAMVHAARGDVDQAYDWLERAATTHDSGLSFAIFDPILARVRADPRWPGFTGRTGLSLRC